MKAEYTLALPGVLLIQVTLLLGLKMVHPEGGKEVSNPSTTGGVISETRTKGLLSVSLEFCASPVPDADVGEAVNALMVLFPRPALAVPANVTVAVAFGASDWVMVSIMFVPLLRLKPMLKEVIVSKPTF
jgi:hypothetical protein